ncbi:peptidoglycan editing factor PgeF [Phycobacter sp. K97]|jgi:YfiH family protein|uniref:peptidoglycan editing factor PgeF n=1 Tax=Phycobacter sedimenti TaxID=3133977 RepID=UPI00311D428B
MTLEILTSDLLSPLRHGFFTRHGGASSGIFEGLNCGLGSSDQREAVALNRARVAAAMEVAPEQLARVNQIHSPDVAVIEEAQGELVAADAMVTRVPGLALSILTADCQPVLFADPEGGVIGAAHAGWRGALDGVLEATVDEMVRLGASRDRIRAVIGPTISQRAYEVGPEFFEDFMAENPENARFFANGEGDRFLFDLPGLGLHKLRSAGIQEAQWTRHCTYSDPKRFYSYRRATHESQADYGRLISCIRL